MKKLILIALFAIGIVGLAQATPQFSREGDKNLAGYVTGVSRSSDGVIKASPTLVYGVTLQPTSSSGIVLLYDNASAASGTIKVEIAEATSGASKRITFNPPMSFDNGIYADVTNGNVNVEYR